MDAIIVITHLPDQQSAVALAEHLVDAGLAACVNALAPCRSLYHWQGKTETAEETPLFIKTTQGRYKEVERAIVARHPYELPDILAVPVTSGLPAYLDWVATSGR